MQVFYGLTNHSQLKRIPRDIAIMVSARWLIRVSPRSIAFRYISEFDEVFLDSGAFGAAFYDGGYTYSPDEYLELVARMKPRYWASMDFPCELSVRNEETVEERIDMTVANAKVLSASNLPGFVPVIQGWEPADYLQCANKLQKAELLQPLIAIGSLCRRGRQEPIVSITRHLSATLPTVAFHAFGVKITALRYNNGEILNYLHSIDTAAWQFNEKDDQGGWRPRTHQEITKRLEGYRIKLNNRLKGPYQLVYRHGCILVNKGEK